MKSYMILIFLMYMPALAFSPFEKKMEDAGQAMQELQEIFQVINTHYHQRENIDGQSWLKLLNAAQTLLSDLRLSLAWQCVYEPSQTEKGGKLSKEKHKAAEHRKRYSLEAILQRYPDIKAEPDSWEYALLKNLELIPENGEYPLKITIGLLKEEPPFTVGKSAYHAVTEWATAHGKLEINQDIALLLQGIVQKEKEDTYSSHSGHPAA